MGVSIPQPIEVGPTPGTGDCLASLRTSSTTAREEVVARPTFRINLRSPRATSLAGGVIAAMAVLGLWAGLEVAWLVAGVVAGLAVRAAQLDTMTMRIPNGLVLLGTAVLAASVPVVFLVEKRA